MDSVRRIFFIFFALLVSFNLVSYPKQSFYRGAKPGAFNIFEENGKIGLKNDQGQVVIPAEYEALGWSNGDFSLIGNVTGYRSKGLWGLINTQNNKVTKPTYEDLSPGQGEVLVARKKISGSITIRSGCINLSGKELVPFLYDGILVKSFRAIVYTRTGNQFKHGLIDLDGNVLIPLQYQHIYSLGSLRFAVENFGNKTAIFSENGNQLCDFLIDSLSGFKKDLAIVYQNQHQGVIDRNGVIKVAPELSEIKLNDDGSISRKRASSWLFIDSDNRLLHTLNADSIMTFGNHLFKINAGGKSQLIDNKFEPVTSDWFSEIQSFRNNTAVFKSAGKVGLLNKQGKILIKPSYNSLCVDNGIVVAQNISDKRFMLLDSVANPLSPRSYEAVRGFNGKFFPVRNRGFWGGVDQKGKEIIACTHDSIGQVLDNLVVVKFKGKHGVINLQEQWVVTPQNNVIQLLNSERYLLHGEKTKFLKSLKNELIYFSDNELMYHKGFLIETLQSGSYLKIDMNGLIAQRFDHLESASAIDEESEGLKPIKKDGRFGFVDNRGRLRIANRYESVKAFSESLAPVMIRGKWGFINHEDQIAIQPVYDQVEPFKNGFSIVRQKEFYGLIDQKGRLILPVKYQSIEVLGDKKIRVKQNGFWGLSENSGKILLHPKFESLTPLDNGYAIISKDNKFGVVTLDGMSTIPQIYDGLSYDSFRKIFIGVRQSEWKVETLN